MATIRLAVCQANPRVGDFSYNSKLAKEFVGQSKIKRPDVVVFPEMFITGYPPEDLLLKRHFVIDNLRTLNKIRMLFSHCIGIVGFVDKDENDNLYNAAAIVHKTKVVGVYHKRALPNYGVFDEKRYFLAGNKTCRVNIEKHGLTHAIGISICEDIWDEKGVVLKETSQENVDTLLNLSASPYHFYKQPIRRKILSGVAKRLNANVVYSNMVGGQDELVFDGRSMVYDSMGRLQKEANGFEEDILYYDVTMRQKKISRKNQSLKSGCNVIPIAISHDKERSRIPSQTPKKLETDLDILKALILGTRDYVDKNGFRGVWVSVSGGIDSAVVLAIAVMALGRKRVSAVTMPSYFSSKETINDAKLIACNLKIPIKVVSIEGLRVAYSQTLRPFVDLDASDIVRENIQARIRGNLLMSLSNYTGDIVLTTGNKSELATGYCTLYGDMAGGFAVLKDVPKTRVYKLAKIINKVHQKNVIPIDTIKRHPSAELRLNQRDSDTLPDYSLLDKILEEYVEKDLATSQIVKKYPLIPKKHINRSLARVDSNEYKRRQAPPGIRITSKGFGRDRRIPITNLYQER